MINRLISFTSDLAAVFFDFDGVLVDSVPIKTEAFQTIMEPYGSKAIQFMTDYHLSHGGVDRYRKIRYVFDALRLSYNEQLVDDLAHQFSVLVKEKVCRAPLIPGMQDLLKEFDKKQIKMFVVSGTPHDELCEIIRYKNIEQYFLETCGSPRSKVDILKALVSQYKIDVPCAVFVGDAAGDFLAAKECGILFIGV